MSHKIGKNFWHMIKFEPFTLKASSLRKSFWQRLQFMENLCKSVRHSVLNSHKWLHITSDDTSNSKVFETENEYPRCIPTCIHLWWCRAIDNACWVCTNVLHSTQTYSFKLSIEFLHIYSPKSGDFGEKSNQIQSLMRCQRLGLLRKH